MTSAALNLVAFSSEGPTLSHGLDPRFGRAGGFVIVELDTRETRYVDNGSSQVLAQGSGIQATENLARAGAQVLVTGFVGPKAFAALEAAGIRVVQGLEDLTVGEALKRFETGALPFTDGPNRQERQG